MVDYTPLDSSNVEGVAYDPDLQRMRVMFKGHREYTYYGVPLSVYFKLLVARSAGEFINRNVAYQYPYRRGA